MDQYPKRYEIINNIIKYKSYKDYLEIGCFNDENFNKIKIENKIGVDQYLEVILEKQLMNILKVTKTCLT